MGTFLQVVAESWLIYQLTESTLWLGVLGFVGLLPVVPIAFLGGVLADRVPRRRLIMATQLGLLAQAAVFGILVATDNISVWSIILLDFVMGAFYAVDQPARQAFLPELVAEDDLPNAIALNSAVFQISRVIGQAAAQIFGHPVKLVDSANAVAEEVRADLVARRLARTGAEGDHQFYVTDDSRFSELAQRFLGERIDVVHHADL